MNNQKKGVFFIVFAILVIIFAIGIFAIGDSEYYGIAFFEIVCAFICIMAGKAHLTGDTIDYNTVTAETKSLLKRECIKNRVPVTVTKDNLIKYSSFKAYKTSSASSKYYSQEDCNNEYFVDANIPKPQLKQVAKNTKLGYSLVKKYYLNDYAYYYLDEKDNDLIKKNFYQSIKTLDVKNIYILGYYEWFTDYVNSMTEMLGKTKKLAVGYTNYQSIDKDSALIGGAVVGLTGTVGGLAMAASVERNNEARRQQAKEVRNRAWNYLSYLTTTNNRIEELSLDIFDCIDKLESAISPLSNEQIENYAKNLTFNTKKTTLRATGSLQVDFSVGNSNSNTTPYDGFFIFNVKRQGTQVGVALIMPEGYPIESSNINAHKIGLMGKAAKTLSAIVFPYKNNLLSETDTYTYELKEATIWELAKYDYSSLCYRIEQNRLNLRNIYQDFTLKAFTIR